MKKNTTPTIFISYTSNDKEFAFFLESFFKNIFIEKVKVIRLGSEACNLTGDWLNKTIEAIKKCNIYISIYSNDVKHSNYYNIEFGIALAKNIPIYQIFNPSVNITDLKEPYSRYFYYDLTIKESFNNLINVLSQELKTPLVSNIEYNDFKNDLHKINKRLFEVHSMQFLGQKDIIYNEAIKLVEKTKTKIRATCFHNSNPNTPDSFINAIASHLKKNKEGGNPINYIAIASKGIDFTNRFRIFKEYDVIELVEIFEIEAPTVLNILIVDNVSMHISFPEISGDNDGFRNCIQVDNKDVVTKFADWYDNYLLPKTQEKIKYYG